MANYFLNGLLLIAPILVWNWVFASKLPGAFRGDIFEKDIPAFITWGENIFRLVVMILPAGMPLRIATQNQKLGLMLYAVGVGAYFLAWAAQMTHPDSKWSRSAPGFLAPAYTPLIWLTGIGMIGSSLYFPSPYRTWMYFLAAVIFTGFHIAHTAIVYLRTR
jgi:hypothetical protein